MSRLIDATKIMLHRSMIHHIGGCAMVRVEDVQRLITEQPTAYDVDKVVEELEKWSSEVQVVSEVNGKIHRVKVVNAGRAIDIARNGGVE